MSNTPVADYLTIASPDATALQLRTIPNAKGTYKHNDGDNEYRRYNVWFNFEGKRYDVNNSVGSSTVTITEVGVMPATGAYYDGFIKGSFSGTFVAEDNSQIVITNGFFYAESYPQF